MHRRIS